ncbi:MAG: hypothetical protein M3409_09505 [Gemmatimonadota bacterium]|nr:hypothetical protein [Gemmatimonadota bacterium]
MSDTRVVDLHVELPNDVAAQVEQAQRANPDFLARTLQYVMLRRSVFDALAERGGLAGGGPPR